MVLICLSQQEVAWITRVKQAGSRSENKRPLGVWPPRRWDPYRRLEAKEATSAARKNGVGLLAATVAVSTANKEVFTPEDWS
jgi:hypothetical protein